jgi:hypothetical protein
VQYLIINRTRSGLSADAYAELANRAKAFYSNIPEGLVLQGNWSEHEGSRTIALLETDDPAVVEAIQAPFRDFVDMEVIPLVAVEGFRDSALD